MEHHCMGGHAAGAAHRVFHAEKRVQAKEKYHRRRDPALRGSGGCGGARPAGAVRAGAEADVLGDAGGGGSRPVYQERRSFYDLRCGLDHRAVRCVRGPLYPVQQVSPAAQRGVRLAADGGSAPGGHRFAGRGGGNAVALPMVVFTAVFHRLDPPVL